MIRPNRQKIVKMAKVYQMAHESKALNVHQSDTGGSITSSFLNSDKSRYTLVRMITIIEKVGCE